MINFISRQLDYPDAGKLILRASFAAMMLLHGLHKIIYGIDGISGLVTAAGLPNFIAYGVYFGEVVAPILLLAGLFTRIAALIMSGTMIFAWALTAIPATFTLTKVGAWGVENMMVFFFAAIAIALIGPGRYSFDKKLGIQ